MYQLQIYTPVHRWTCTCMVVPVFNNDDYGDDNGDDDAAAADDDDDGGGCDGDDDDNNREDEEEDEDECFQKCFCGCQRSKTFSVRAGPSVVDWWMRWGPVCIMHGFFVTRWQTWCSWGGERGTRSETATHGSWSNVWWHHLFFKHFTICWKQSSALQFQLFSHAILKDSQCVSLLNTLSLISLQNLANWIKTESSWKLEVAHGNAMVGCIRGSWVLTTGGCWWWDCRTSWMDTWYGNEGENLAVALGHWPLRRIPPTCFTCFTNLKDFSEKSMDLLGSSIRVECRMLFPFAPCLPCFSLSAGLHTQHDFSARSFSPSKNTWNKSCSQPRSAVIVSWLEGRHVLLLQCKVSALDIKTPTGALVA